MRAQLDRTEQRILGVLIEKEMSVPETYPLTLNSLVAGCNQKSNREPTTSFEEFEVQGAITSLCLKDWVVRREGSRATKFAHQVEARLGVGPAEKAILAELLVRGPQTPMELKIRVARMGVHRDGDAMTTLLEAMAAQPMGALVELLPRRPRERDARWRHLLGPNTAALNTAEGSPAEHSTAEADEVDEPDLPPRGRSDPASAAGSSRLAALEARVAELERRLDQLSGA